MGPDIEHAAFTLLR